MKTLLKPSFGAALILASSAFSSLAHATTYRFNVNTTVDSHDQNTNDNVCADSSGLCSLRAAVEQANAISARSSDDYSSIRLEDEEITLTLSVDSLTMLKITGNMTILGGYVDGVQRNNAVIRKNASTRKRVLSIEGNVKVSLENITIKNGNVYSADGGGGQCGGGLMISRESKVSARHLNVRDNVAHNNYGAGICNQGKLSLFRSNVSHNRSTDTRPGEGQEFVGGGIYNVGYLELYSSSVMNNSAMQGGGIYTSTVGINTFDGLGGKLIVQSSTIAQNDALYGGAGIFSDYGEAMIAFSTLSDNVSKRPTVSSSKPSEYGALAIKGSDDFFNANYQPSYNAGQTAFVQGCVSCHATRPINSSNYTYESMSAKIYNTMKSLAPSCNAQCSQDIAHYLVHSGGEGSNDSIFGEMPSVLVYGNIIAGNYEDSTSSWPWSYNCNSIDDESFAEGSGYNTWGRDESTCNNAYSSTDSFLGFSRERPSKLQMEYTRLDHANAALMQMYWPDAWGLWSLYAPASDVRVAMPDWDIWHYFNNTVPTDCAPGVNCTVNRVIDGALKIKSVEGPFTPGAFQFE